MKRQLFSLLLVLLFTGTAFSQADTVNFGEIYRSTQRYADIKIRNITELTTTIAKIEHSPEVVYRVDREYINPDSLLTVRIQVNPDTTGHFNHVMRIYLSNNDEPIEMRVIGDVVEMPDYTDLLQQKCPEFNAPKAKETHTEFTVTSVDAETHETIGSSTVTIISNGQVSESWVTGSTGSLRRDVPPGFLYFVVSREGYETTETGVFITPDIETVYIPLKKARDYERYKEPKTPDSLIVKTPVKVPDNQVERVLQNQIATDSAVADSPDAFDTAQFRPVNIVFVLDVSSSMKMGEKMNLLKYSLNQLVGHLRDEDRISFVTYADGANVYMKPTYCSDKSPIRAKIADLSPDGMGSSTRGIKLGYKELTKHMLPGEADMVIVITDGAFNNYSNDYEKIVQKYAASGITFSVVGIQCHTRDERNMREAAEFGHGRYVPINKLVDAQLNLLREIRIASYKGI